MSRLALLLGRDQEAVLVGVDVGLDRFGVLFTGRTKELRGRVLRERGRVLLGLLECLLHPTRGSVHIDSALELVGGVTGNERLGVGDVEGELLGIEMRLLGHVERVLTVVELDDGRVRVSNRVIVVNSNTLEMLDETSLKVTRTRRLDGRVNEALSTGHAMEVILLRSDARQESVGDVTTGSGGRLERLERRQRLARDHRRDSTTLERLLTEDGRDHGSVGGGSLGSRDGHHLHVVIREGLDELVGNHRRVDLGGRSSEPSLHDVVETSHESVISKDLLESNLKVEVDFGIVWIGVLAQTDVSDGCLLALGVNVAKHLGSLNLTRRREHEVVHSASESARLEVLGEESREDREQLARRRRTIDFHRRVNESVRDGTKLGLVEDSDEELAIDEKDLVLLRVGTPKLVLDLVLGGEVKTLSVFGLDVKENGRNLAWLFQETSSVLCLIYILIQVQSATEHGRSARRKRTSCFPVQSGLGFQIVGGIVTIRPLET